MPESTSIGSEIWDDPLAEAGLRLRWANEDGEAFNALSKWFAETNAYAVHVQREGDRWQATWHRLIEPSIEAEKFSELARHLGSFLDHTRAALNYATYQLALKALRHDPALKGSLSPEAVEFPIFSDPTLFKSKNRIKKLPNEYRNAIEAVQPYDGRYPGLWVLHELSREYRHRVIHPTAILPADNAHMLVVNGQPTQPSDLEIFPHERLEHGDVIMRFSLDTIDPNPNVHPYFVTTVSIDHVLCRELIGVSVLNQVRSDTEVVLDVIEPLLS